MYNDASNIFNLYLEAVEEQPQMTTDEFGIKGWRLHGKPHRRDGPAFEGADGYKEWRLHGKRHREDGPAVEWAGSKEWWLHDKPHRMDGPAIERADGYKEWRLHGKTHREDGPAIELADGSKRWYLHDKQYANAEAWAKALLKRKNKPHDAASVDAFLRPILKKYIAL